jgi:hypothetical protein
MRNMNCRKIRREIEEAAPGDLLSASANNHMLSCVACETFSREQTKLQEIISSLGTVEAPGDFDFRLRARLASEKRGPGQSLMLGDFSFGLRAAAVAAVLLLIGSAFVFVSFKTRSDNPATAGVPKTSPNPKEVNSVESNNVVNNGASAVAQAPQANLPGGNEVNVKSSGSPGQPSGKGRRFRQTELASFRGNNRVGTRDLSSTQAAVLKGYDQVLDTYPTTAFPINGSYQSMKVSVDDGRGTSRTISLPSVSFGSQRTLSQGASPLMASARGAW